MNYHEGDRRPYLQLELQRGDSPVPGLNTATAIRLLLWPHDDIDSAPLVTGVMAVVDEPTALVEYQWTATDLDTAGTYLLAVEIEWDNGELETLPDTGYLTLTVHRKGAAA